MRRGAGGCLGQGAVWQQPDARLLAFLGEGCRARGAGRGVWFGLARIELPRRC